MLVGVAQLLQNGQINLIYIYQPRAARHLKVAVKVRKKVKLKRSGTAELFDRPVV